MQKYNLSKITKKAHQLAKQMIGDYAACLKEGMRLAWAQAKTEDEPTFRYFSIPYAMSELRDLAKRDGNRS